MEYLVVSRIIDDNRNLVGFTVIGQNEFAKFLSIQQIESAYNRLKLMGRTQDMNFLNAEYSETGKTLNGTMGSLTKYPAIDTRYNLVSKGGITVLKVVLNKDTKKPIGCICYNATGVRYNLSFKKMMELARNNIETNYEFKDVDGVQTVVPKGNIHKAFPTVEMEIRKKSEKIYRSADGETVNEVSCGMTLTGKPDNNSLPSITGVYSLDDTIKTSDFNKSANEKLAEASYNLMRISPYYYSMLQAIERYPMQGLGTMGVTENRLYYDIGFVANLPVSELTFILIHEMCHIAMQHSIRQGTRNHDLWNIATDLYINTIICNDFSDESKGQVLLPGGSEIKVTSPNGEDTGVLKCPNIGVFVETTGSTLDLSHDVPESLYLKLLKENPQFSQSGSSNQQSQQGSQGQQGSQSQQSGSSNQQSQQGSQGQQGSQSQQSGSSGQQSQQGSQSQSGGQSSQSQSGSQGSQSQSGGQGSQSGQPDEKAFENAVKKLAKSMEKANKNTWDNGSQGDGEKSDEGCQEAVDGINQVREGIQNNNQSQIQQGNQKIQSGIDKINQAQRDAGVDKNKSGKSASNGMDKAKQDIDKALGQGQGQNQGQGQGQGQQDGSQGESQQGNGQQSGSSQGNGQQGGLSGSSGSGGSADSGDDVFSNESNSSFQQNNEGLDDLNSDSSFNNKAKDVEVTFNGKKIKGKIIDDIMSNHDESTIADIKARMDESKQALQNIETKRELDKQKNPDGGYGVGGAGSLTQRYIEYGLAEGVDWRTLLKNVCKREKKKMYTLSHPNKTYMQMGRTISSRQVVGNTNALQDIKICIDVSGSVCDEDLNKYISEINNIFRYYQVDGELIYWSTEIGDVGNFSKLKDLLKIKPASTGGTDVKCVFDYLSGKIKVNGKLEETKLKDISCVLIITDGFFNKNYTEYAKYFGKKTIWLIDGSPITFDKAFGKVVSIINEK